MKLNKIVNLILTTSPLLAATAEGDNSSQISLKIKTKWNQNSPSLELLELLASENPSHYYPTLDLIFKNIVAETQGKTSVQKTFQDTLTKLKSKFGSKVNYDLLNLGLSLKLSSSKLEAKLNYYDSYVKDKFTKECGDWIQVGDNEQFCDVDEFEKWLESNKLNNSENELELLPFDITRTCAVCNLPKVIYYTNFNSKSFEFYTRLAELTIPSRGFNFVLRYQPNRSAKDSKKVELSGYGVYLDLKNTEYKVQDDRYQNKNDKDSKLTSEESDASSKIPVEYKSIWNEDLSHFQQNIQQIQKYEDSDLEGFNQKFTQLAKSSKSPLQTWIYLLQNLPHHAQTVLNETLAEGHCEGITLGRNFFFQQPIQDQILINGIEIDLGQLDIFNLVKFLNLEFNTFKLFNYLGITNEEARNLLIGKSDKGGDEELESAKERKSLWENVYNTRDNVEGEDNKVVIWLNNIEEDEVYEDWSSELSSLQTYMYGYLPQTRRNFANSVFPLNLNNLDNLHFFAKNLIKFSSSPVPIRFGLVTLVDEKNSEDSKKINNLVHYLFEHLAKSELKEYLEDVVKSSTESNEPILNAFKSHYSSLKKNNPSLKLDLTEVFNISDSEYITPTINYSNRLQLKLDEEVLFINGKRVEFEGNFQKPLIQNLFQQIPVIMEMASEGEFDNGSVYDIWLNNSQVLNNFNPLLKEDKFEDLELTSWISDNKENNGPLNKFKFIRSNTNTDANENDSLTTVWIVGNFESAESNTIIEDAIKYLKSGVNGVRLSFVPTDLNGKSNELLFNLINDQDQFADLPETIEELKNFKFPNKPNVKEVLAYFSRAQSYFNEASGANINKDNEDSDGIQLILDTKNLKVSTKEFEFIKFGSIVDYYNIKFKTPLASRLSGNLNGYSKLSEVEKSDTLIQVSAILNQNLKVHQSLVRFGSYEGERGTLPEINRPQCELKLAHEDEKEDTWANIEFILDPLGDNAAKWSSILNKLGDIDGVKLKGYFSPNSPPSEFKKTHLNRFYRYLLPSNLEFDETEKELKAPKIEFSDLPESSLLTLGMDTMTSWVVMAKDSPHDLDNLKLSSLPSTGTHPEFELKHLLIEGHCTDFDRRPPRGLEFNLGNKENPNIVDTIVMANLGYFQFKANPGVWQMRIRPGKSEDVYELVNIGDQGHSKSGKYVDEGRTLILDSLSGITLFPKVKKRKGMEDVDLLEVKEEEKPKTGGGMWDKLFGGSKKPIQSLNETNPHGDINVFTVASGHLYERFLSVMVASVMKNTDRKVKFWFIENFLSPSFKKFIPKLSEKYNFTYQLVTYQWPHWLNIPSEKQRIIWGYKILFLDVLFPLDLDKVIFVDADQSVRADLGELVDLDLEGKPYGYTPFCTSRESMKGYRFWEQGYWKSHLDGKPYHISALYVVDLKRFRSQAAGDILRQHYQMLSQDPNSLANLDQDLPNHLQHELPIFSLPQEWLWCETWCDDASLKSAKTIDLCNNPETKEPKLDRARRILPEWQKFDDEVRSIDTEDEDATGKDKKDDAKDDGDKSAEDEEL